MSAFSRYTCDGMIVGDSEGRLYRVHDPRWWQVHRLLWWLAVVVLGRWPLVRAALDLPPMGTMDVETRTGKHRLRIYGCGQMRGGRPELH